MQTFGLYYSSATRPASTGPRQDHVIATASPANGTEKTTAVRGRRRAKIKQNHMVVGGWR
jgi:hypothetical protein